MREICFRGLSKATGKWVEGCLIYDFESGYVSQFMEDVPPRTWQIFDFNGHRHEVEPSSVGQFCGLLDKNGNRIFEGMLLHRHMNVYWRVTFKDSKWIADEMKPISGLYLDASQFIECEIIDPELLNQ